MPIFGRILPNELLSLLLHFRNSKGKKEHKEVYECLSILLSTHIGLSLAAPGSALGYYLLGTFSTCDSQWHRGTHSDPFIPGKLGLRIGRT